MSVDKETVRVKLLSFMLLTLVSLNTQAAAVASDEAGYIAFIWNLLISLIVLLVSVASAVLPVAAIRQWAGVWRAGAAASLLVLLIWVAVIIISRSISADTHRLWPFEIFAWAMINMIYMVALMTAKRIFERADQRAVEEAAED